MAGRARAAEGRRPARAAALVLVALATGCAGASGPGVSRGEWKASYLAARDALEAGRAAEAARVYARIVDASGPVGPRVRLEYAHALLRADAFPAAAEQARRSAAGQDGLGRAAALAVQAVAEHEAARADLAAGQADRRLAERLAAAGTTLDAALAADARVDPGGTLASRRAELAAEATGLRRRLGL